MGKDGLPQYARLLAAARHDRGLSSDRIAKLLGVSPSTYRNAEAGRGTPAIFKNLGNVLGDAASLAISAAWRDSRATSEATSYQDLLIPMPLMKGLVDARLTRFFPSRSYYQLLREGNPTIGGYVSTATRSVEMVSINLATGVELEGLVDVFEELLSRRPAVRVTVSLLDPELTYLMQAISPVIGASAKALSIRITDAIASFEEFHRVRLSRSRRTHFELWCHGAIPNASAILLDGDLETGRIQLETKGYKTGMDKSYGFEAAAPSQFFSTLRDSYRRLISDGRRVL